MTAGTQPAAGPAPAARATRAPGGMAAGQRPFRWDSAVGFRGAEFLTFGAHYFGADTRRVVLIAGAGFDPRAPRLAEHLARWAPSRVSAVFVREERPIPDPLLRALADEHAARIRAAIPNLTEQTLTIFDPTDLAVVGGRQAANLVRTIPLAGTTDVVVDLSALSVGTSFPLVRALLQLAAEHRFNLHTTVVADAALDATILPQPAETATAIHGFRGELGMDRRADAAKLWLPQLAFGRRELLDRVHAELGPHDTCPILPFPAHDPRVGDQLVDEYLPALMGAWDVDPRNIIYAAEDDPLDVYRTILELDDARRPVFDGDGGSLCVLSPAGSKVLGLGALMAATERDFPILHVEAVGFIADAAALREYTDAHGAFAHVWLAGDPYTVAAPAAPAGPISP
ncbi:hypothetical protein [Gemmatimonas aurantiaca]|uniref:hypothetical protein n=1 Tax=Gemmatimonas aurantiaca TaxID=173480 RepID=UPI00301C4051